MWAQTHPASCIRSKTPAKRDIPIITFNPLRVRSLERFTNPQNPVSRRTFFCHQQQGQSLLSSVEQSHRKETQTAIF